MAWGAMRNGLCFTSRPVVLVQLGARYLRRLFMQRFEFIQNGNGLSVDGVQMKRSHANGRLVFKRSDEHRRTQEPLDFLCNRVGLFGIKVVEKRHECRLSSGTGDPCRANNP